MLRISNKGWSSLQSGIKIVSQGLLRYTFGPCRPTGTHSRSLGMHYRTPKRSLFWHNLVIVDPCGLQPLAPLDPGKHPLFWGLLTFPHLDLLPGLDILPGIIFLYSWRGINWPQLTVSRKRPFYT